MIDPNLRSQISPELEHGEKLLWVGQPTPFRVLMQAPEELFGALVAVVLMGVIFTIFLPLSGAAVMSRQPPFAFFLVIFLVIMAASLTRPLYEYFVARRTVYAMTDQRALIIKPGWNGQSVNSYYQIEHIERRNLANERGDLIFAHEPYSQRGRYGYRSRVRKIGFFGIDQPREVERLLVENLTGAAYPEFRE